MAFGAIAPLAWMLMLALPGEHRRWRALRAAVRRFFTLAGLRVEVLNSENVPVNTPFVAVANHSSYLDGLVALLALPCPVTFVVNAKFARYRYTLGLMMRRVGVVFVSHGRADSRRLIDEAKRGRSLVLFPEGGIESSRCLAPFHMGAFVIAARARYPILPIAIRGSRRVLPPGAWRPRRTSILVRFGQAIPPASTDPSAITKLQAATRRAITERLKELSQREKGHGISETVSQKHPILT
jgi:1-acyl-sn-glycerol-3-phosphate acyltransferase